MWCTITILVKGEGVVNECMPVMHYMILHHTVGHTLFHVFKLFQHICFCPAKKKKRVCLETHWEKRSGENYKKKSRAGEFDDSWSRCRGGVGEDGEEEDGGKRAIKESILQHWKIRDGGRLDESEERKRGREEYKLVCRS